MSQEPENNLIIFYGGIGDTLLWIPTLKSFVIKPDVLYLYGTPALNILSENGLINKSFEIKSKVQLINFTLQNLKRYDNIFLNHLCGGEFLLTMMNRCSDSVITNSPNFNKGEGSKLHQKKADLGIHDSLQNYLLVHGRIPQLTSDSFKLNLVNIYTGNLPETFVTLQLGAGNNQTPYKNWPVKHWTVFIDFLLQKFPGKKFLLLGSSDEAELVQQLNINHPNLISLVGKTSVSDAFSVISKSELFIGPDGGLMHIAVSVAVSTFTIWGGSSAELYGYNHILGKSHGLAKLKLNCMPCNSWLNPNHLKTKDPLKCPDFACLRDLTPAHVIETFNTFFNENN